MSQTTLSTLCRCDRHSARSYHRLSALLFQRAYSNPLGVVVWSQGFSRIRPPKGSTPFHNQFRIAIRHKPAGLRHKPAGLRHKPAGLRRIPAGLRHKPAGLRHKPAGLRRIPAGLRHKPAGLRRIPAGLRHVRPCLHHDPICVWRVKEKQAPCCFSVRQGFRC